MTPSDRIPRGAALLCAATCALHGLPGLAVAEGSVYEVSCTAATLCDAAGGCSGDASALEFTVAPLSQDGDLRTFELVMDGKTYEAQQNGATGPFVWDSKVLVPMGGDAALLIRQAGDAEALFLTCEGLG
ncbi:hypothetical protein [Psychromarinibacter sp. S121]|uniref:hypothetical protein n=1 Tax=Psychromarinibacter sp. S121 TaxID=3415127 RepID=UPI003C7D1538